jgi:DNA helicase-2/ATP-dependent DNA helicase PcrA
MDSEDELAEERRLFYVGLTRAEDTIYLSHAFRRTSWGDSSVSVPSRFLNDIPEEFVDGQGAGNRRRASIDRASMWNPTPITWDKPARAPADYGLGNDRRSPAYPTRSERPASRPDNRPMTNNQRPSRNGPTQFKTGQKVRHSKFGEGTVIESRMTGGDEEVTVAFPGTGIKRLAASLAGLELVG